MPFIKVTLKGLFITLYEFLNQNGTHNVISFTFVLKSSLAKYLM